MSINYIKLAEKAALLDSQGKYEEADEIASFLKTSQQTTWQNIGDTIQGGVEALGNMAYRASVPGVIQTVSELKDAATNHLLHTWNTTMDAAVKQRVEAEMLSRGIDPKKQQKTPSQPSSLSDRYLGYGVSAVQRAGLTKGRAELLNHLQRSKQSPQFQKDIMLRFDNWAKGQKNLKP